MEALPRRLVPFFAALIVAACGGAGGAPTQTSAPASAAAATTGTPAPVASLGVGGLSISSILGSSATAPASTTWSRVSDPGAPFSFEAPSTWLNHAAYPWQQGGQAIGTVLAAGPDLSKLATDFSVPGIVIGLSANTGSLTARQVVEADDYSRTCSAGQIQDTTASGASASFRLFEHCAGGTGFLLVLAIVPADGKGLVGIVFQGAADADLGYLEHIGGSLQAATPSAAPSSAATGGPVTGQTFTITMNLCQNQHGQGVAEGLIRNDDTLVHAYRIVVAFNDPNNVFLNDTAVTKSDIPPGVTATWQAMVPSGLPSVTVSCVITKVELVN